MTSRLDVVHFINPQDLPEEFRARLDSLQNELMRVSIACETFLADVERSKEAAAVAEHEALKAKCREAEARVNGATLIFYEYVPRIADAQKAFGAAELEYRTWKESSISRWASAEEIAAFRQRGKELEAEVKKAQQQLLSLEDLRRAAGHALQSQQIELQQLAARERGFVENRANPMAAVYSTLGLQVK